ncbi:MAG: 23S rRNA (adenine(2503)-C(2))-methyltransferase RlmN [Bacillota bacterium]
MMNFYDMTHEQLKTYLKDHGFKPFAATQLFEWVYKKDTFDFHAMSNIAKALREHMVSNFVFKGLALSKRQVASDGTKKFLFELEDGLLVESVLMEHDYGLSLCVTTQVGCNMGCTFCASGLKKKTRDLTTGEMVAQVQEVQALESVRISHVVVMGTGEPFDNYDNTMDFIRVINHPKALEIGARHITVSTAGVVPMIERFAEAFNQVNLAISLHAADDETRDRLMPINRKYPLKSLMKSAHDYVRMTNRRITFEYLLIGGVNDSIEHADALSDLLRGLNCYVNLIPYNPVSEFDFKSSAPSAQRAFYDRLKKRGIQVTLRREKGGDIDAACGQLRSQTMKERGEL